MPTITIPYASLGAQSKPNKSELLQAVERVIDSGAYILGQEVSRFEKEFASYCETSFAVGVANGTCALHLALRALGVGEGDEVITAPNSFVASASSIALVGARPVFADIRKDLNIDPHRIRESITSKTKAIIPVHLTGRPAAMDEILAIAKEHNLFVVEDVAQAIGARYKGGRVGSFGDLACFSLHPLKNLYAFGDAGMITVKTAELLEHLQKARSHGFRNRNECDFFSFNCRLDEMQAAMLRVQLEHLEEWTNERRRLAKRYNDALRGVAIVPDEGPDEYCVYQTYMIQVPKRDQLLAYLETKGIEAKIHYPVPIHMQKASEYLGYNEESFPETMRAAAAIMSLPLYPGLTEDQQETVIKEIKSFYAGSL